MAEPPEAKVLSKNCRSSGEECNFGYWIIKSDAQISGDCFTVSLKSMERKIIKNSSVYELIDCI